jgi:hypothetical protein
MFQVVVLIANVLYYTITSSSCDGPLTTLVVRAQLFPLLKLKLMSILLVYELECDMHAVSM